jgi:sarcosine oxidase
VAALDVDVAVVGAGVIGCAAARELARQGLSVALLEQFDVGHDRGSSHGASRIFRLSYPDERYVRLAQAALGGWRALEEELGEELLVRAGSLDLGAYASLNARALSACGAEYETVSGREAGDRWPVRLDPDERTLYQPDAGTLLSDRCLRALLESARAAGAVVRERSPVHGISVERGSVAIEAGTGQAGARAVVVAAGAWSASLLSPLGIELPVVPTRETVAHFRAPGSREVPCVIDDTTPSAGIDGLLRAGSLTYALSSPGIGVKVGLHHSGPVADPDVPGQADEGVVRWASEWIGRRFPAADPDPVSVETCLYTSTADESFVLERHGRVVVASACSGHAFKFAPALGRTIAGLAMEAAGTR